DRAPLLDHLDHGVTAHQSDGEVVRICAHRVLRDPLDGGGSEARVAQRGANRGFVGEPERRLVETRRLAGEERGDRLMRDAAEGVGFEGIPDVEDVTAALAQDPPRLAYPGELVGEE